MKVFSHTLFWIIIVALLTLMFGSSYENYVEPFLFVSMLLPAIAGTAYFFNYYLVPRYLFEKRTFRFILYSCYLLIISLYLEMVVVIVAFILLARYRYDHMVPLAADIPFLAVILYGIVFLYGFTMLARKSLVSQKKIQELEEEKNKQEDAFLLVRAQRKTNRISLDDIEYLESLGDYVKIHTSSFSPITTKEKISKLETKLPDSFLRIHRSYIINSKKIFSYNKERIQIKKTNLPISRTYKKSVLDALNNHFQG